MSRHFNSVVQFSGDNCCRGVNPKATLVPGEDIPADAAWAPFVAYKDDNDISGYDIRNGVLFYTRLNLPAPYGPDPVGLKAALNASAIPDAAKVLLTPYLVLLDSYADDPEGTAIAWQRTKAVLNVDTNVAAAIEQLAADYGMVLG